MSALYIPYLASLILLPVAALSVVSVRWSLRALGIVLLIRAVNPALVDGAMGPVTVLGWLVIGLACARIYLVQLVTRQVSPKLLLGLIVFTSVTIALSLVGSDFLGVSLFKIISFSFCAGAVFLGFEYLQRRRIDAGLDIVVAWAGVLIASLPFFLVPGVGYALDGEGFQGVVNHPQLLATFSAPALAWSGIRLVIHGIRAGLISWVIFILSLSESLATKGRTGIAACAISGILCFCVALLSRKDWLQQLVAHRTVMRLCAVGVIAGVLLYVFAGQIMEAILSFVLKRNADEATLAESFEESRGLLIAEEISNFLESPWIGIGFGVSRSAIYPFEPLVEPITGLTIGAATEKANIVVALLEEVGIVGTLAFMPFLVVWLASIARRASLSVAAAAFAILGVNVSEMIFFSVGGMGLYLLLIMGYASAYPDVKGGHKVKAILGDGATWG